MSEPQKESIDRLLRSAMLDPDLTPEQLRRKFAEFTAAGGNPEGVDLRDDTLGDRPAVWFVPKGAETADQAEAILYFHGGAHVFVSPATARHLTAALVRRTGTAAVSLDYRLAPEHPLPAAFEDGVSAYRDLLERGMPPRSIAFAGDSAGGGLVVKTAIAARDGACRGRLRWLRSPPAPMPPAVAGA